MGIVLLPLLSLLQTILNLLIWMVIAQVALSWLISLGIVNSYNPVMGRILDFLNRFVEPMLKPIQRIVPLFGSIDISPVILILLMSFIQGIIMQAYLSLVRYCG